MAQRTWIKVRRGILEPKHRMSLGIALYLYLYMIDRADWKSGTIYDWRDQDAADDMGMSLATLRHQRRIIEEQGYVNTIQHKHRLEITIDKWENPQEKQSNGDNNGYNYGYNYGDNYGDINIATPTSSSHNTYHISHITEPNGDNKLTPLKVSKEQFALLEKIESLYTGEHLTEFQIKTILSWRDQYGDSRVISAFEYYALKSAKLKNAVASVSRYIATWDDRRPTPEPVQQATPEDLAEYAQEIIKARQEAK